MLINLNLCVQHLLGVEVSLDDAPLVVFLFHYHRGLLNLFLRRFFTLVILGGIKLIHFAFFDI